MTDTTLSILSLASLNQAELVKTQNQESAALRLIKFEQIGGPNVAWVSETDGYSASTGTFNEGALFGTPSADAQIAAVLNWGRYSDVKRVSGTALRAAQSYANPMGNANLWMNKLQAAVRKVTSDLGVAFYNGDGTTDKLAGIDLALNDDNIYAGVNRHTAANDPMRAKVIDPGSPTKPTLKLLRSDLSAILKRCGERPDVALVSFELFDAIAALFDSNRHYVDMVLSGGRGPTTLRHGSDFIYVDGCAFVKDKNATIVSSTSHQIKYINTNYISMVCQNPEIVPGDVMGLAQANDGLGPIGMGLMVKGLPYSGDAHPVVAFAECQLKVSKPIAMGCRLQCDPT